MSLGELEAAESAAWPSDDDAAPLTSASPDDPGGLDSTADRHATTTSRRRWAVAALVAIAASVWATGIGREELVNPGGWAQFSAFFAAATSPDLSPEFLRLTLDAAVVTLSFAALGTALSVIIGLVGGLMATSAWSDAAQLGQRRAWGRGAIRVILVPLRSVHEAVWAVVLAAILGLNPLVAILAIGVPFGAVTAKVYADLLDEAPRGPFLALRSAGASRPMAFVYGVLPDASRSLISYGFYRFECAIRAAAVLGVIGAGGLGFELRLSFQSLNYNEMWTLIAALIILCAGADSWGSLLRRRSSQRDRSDRTKAPNRWASSTSLIVAAVALVAAWRQLEVAPSTLWSERSIDAAVRFAQQAWPPQLDDSFRALVESSAQTIAMSILAIAMSFAAAVLIAFPAARPAFRRGKRARGRRRATVRSGSLRLLTLFTRAVPPPVWALVLVFVLFPGVLPGALALGIYNFGVLGRLMTELVEQQDDSTAEVLRAGGASSTQVVLYDRGPRLATSFLAYGLYRWEVTIRETVVVGLVAAGGLGYDLNQQLAAFDYQAVAVTIIALLVITAGVDVISTKARRAIR